ncbi:MAG TPA: hypothetical protein VGU26_06400 [Gaiellaceae bacterium]|nr:hypothetical protein [Gaiellaceae bacterium]
MAATAIPRVRMSELTRLGRSRTGHDPQAGRRPARALRAAASSPMPSRRRQRGTAAPQSGQPTLRTGDLPEAAIQ